MIKSSSNKMMKIIMFRKFIRTMVFVSIFANSSFASSAQDLFWWMSDLNGEWKLSTKHEQLGSCKHTPDQLKLIDVGISFKFIGQETTLQEDLLPNSPRQMVTMYHCKDIACTKIKASHYCVKKNQLEFTANLKDSTEEKMIFECDMSAEICNSNQNHVHTIIHEILEDGDIFKTSYLSLKNQKLIKSTICTFERVEED